MLHVLSLARCRSRGSDAHRRRLLRTVGVAVGALVIGGLPATSARAVTGVTVYVDAAGADTGSCALATQPCASAMYALSQAGDLSAGVTVVFGSLSTAAEQFVGTTTITSGAVTLVGTNPKTVLWGGDGDALDVSGSADVAVHDLAVSASADTHAAVELDGGSLTLSNSVVSGQYVPNAPAAARAIGQTGGNLAVIDSTVHDSPAGIAVAGGNASITGSAIGPDVGTAVGAGAGATVTIVQSTAQAGVSVSSPDAAVSIVASTVGGVANVGGHVGVAGSIIAGGPFIDCPLATVTDDGFNVALQTGSDLPGGSGSCGITPSPEENLRLGPFAMHGGGTATESPTSTSSAAIDQIPRGTAVTVNGSTYTLCASAGTSTSDQRGVPRPQGAACDIGALELASTTTTVSLQADWPGDPTANQSVTANVSAPFAPGLATSGTIRIFDNGVNDEPCDGAAVSGGRASCGSQPLTAGVHAFAVQFGSEDGFAASTGQATETEAPGKFIGSASVTFVQGRTSSATINAVGSPVPSMLWAGALPNGLRAKAVAGKLTIYGAPSAGTAGTYRLTATAVNWSGRTSRTVSILVARLPRITSPSHATFRRSHRASFTIRTSAIPTATLTITGKRPHGLSLKISGGMARLSGKPTSPIGRYRLHVYARNAGGIATQTVTIRIVG